ncbi:transporter substrate-binding domain-containing protein [Pseudarthrobacter phenanthrenivorans]|uniref:transporter substrate-binding domain-containing protein n=1 Tax=Pseudarthrobacter phenanthrenivorans TaxID=361575 RepID=UPI0034507407
MKKFVFGSVAAAAVVALTACSGGAGASSSESAIGPNGLLKSGELSVCMTPQYKPMEFYKDGKTGTQPIGFDADAAVALADSWGVKARFSDVAFDGLMPALQAGRCDVVWSGLYVNEARQQVADAVPYLKTGSVIIAPKDSNIKSAEDLAGKTVAVLAGGAYESNLKELSTALKSKGLPDLIQQSYPQNTQTSAAVTNGKADALIDTDVSVGEIVEKTGGNLQPVPGIFEADAVFGVYVKKGSPLTAEVRNGLKKLATEGKLAEIAKNYALDASRLTDSAK